MALILGRNQSTKARVSVGFLATSNRALRFGLNLLRRGAPRRSLLFGPLSLGDELLCTAVLREARRRGEPFAMMTARPELFAGNPDPERILPIDDDYAAGLRRLGRTVTKPYYLRTDPMRPSRDLLPAHHVIVEMCRVAGIKGDVTLRPYLHLNPQEMRVGRRESPVIALQSSVLSARVPYPTKDWASCNWEQVVSLLRPHAWLVQLGSGSDPALPVDEDLRGKTTLREAAAVLAGSAVFVGLEGFLTHLARAVDCPSVVVMGGRAPEEVFGYAANVNLVSAPTCAPCGLREGCPHDLECMKMIKPDTVLAAALRILESPPERPLRALNVTLPGP